MSTNFTANRLRNSKVDPKDGEVAIHDNIGVSFYDQPPSQTITLFEFESLALARLQTLRKIEFLSD